MSRIDGSQAKLDRQVYKIWVEVLFRNSLETHSSWRDSIHAGPGQDVIALFAKYVERVAPVIAIESSLPYAERLIVDMLREHARFKPPVSFPSLLSGQWQAGRGRPLDARTPLVLSFQETNDLLNSMEEVHHIETTDNPVFLGCNHISQVPAEFQRLIDLKLTLSSASAGDFGKIFETLFGQPLPEEKGAAARWRGFVMPPDVQPPLRLRYTAVDAARYIRDRVIERLTRVEVDNAPSLDDLHGLGEAREIARDLEKDMRLAMQGRIEWDEVDRGLLLVGPPGTGKTTLARAIAKDCGVKFIAVSAGQWMAGDGLGMHLAEIRKTFEEARRFAPTILFIDEIDSIGNRELVSGQHLTYQVTVINYLLELMDGFSERGDVIVIGASNYEDMIDPALRRAGRLDQVIRVSYPTIRALENIYAYHLKDHADAGRLADDIDHGALARLSFGLTGADVEFFVRGAARRARKRKSRISQDDLKAEIMRRPRDWDRSMPFDEEAIYRLAVHEAGHVVMRMQGGSKGKEISYVSIAPRSDGRIGYIATFEDERASMTREDFLHEIRVMLAGRAAEELIFGAEAISDLAGKYGAMSDLAQATKIARYLLGVSGLAGQEDLTWYKMLDEKLLESRQGALDSLLRDTYASVLRALEPEKAKLISIADALNQHQEIDGQELRSLAG